VPPDRLDRSREVLPARLARQGRQLEWLDRHLAIGHLVGMAQAARLATFFPALVFAWLWRRSGSLWAPALFHTAANLLMDLLLASTFPA